MPMQTLLKPSLKQITQYEWERLSKDNLQGLTLDEYYDLLDEYAKECGQEYKIERQYKELLNYGKALKNYILYSSSDNEMDVEMAQMKLKTPESKESDILTPLLFKVYGQIDKTKITVHEYIQLIKALDKWQTN